MVDQNSYNNALEKLPVIGDDIGHYQIKAELGAGGMGKVYKAWDYKLKRMVALKVLVAHNNENRLFLMRFWREVRLISKLQHPNIIKLYDMNNISQIYFYTMEYIQGMSLDQWVEKQQLSYNQIAQIVEKIALAIHYAHEQGIIHRDLNPSNVLVDQKGEPYIMDFGLAKVVTLEGKLTQTGTLLGTPAYMSPEQAQGKNKIVDKQSDLYALGVILYQLLTTQKPFKANNTWELIRQIVEEKPISPRRVNSQIPTSLENICLKAMAKNRHKRYRSAKVLARDLNLFYMGKTVHVRAPVEFRKSYWQAAIFLTAMLLLAWGGYRSWQKNSIKNSQINASTAKVAVAKKDFFYASSLYKQGVYKQAYIHFTQALAHAKPGEIPEAEIKEKLLLIAIELKQYQKAQKQFSQLPQKSKQNTSIVLAMVKAQYHQSFFDKAAHFLTILEKQNLKPKIRLESLYYRSLLLYHGKKYSKALGYLHQVEKELQQQNLSPNRYPLLKFYIGFCFFAQKDYVTAKSYLTKAQKLLPDSAFIYEYLGKCYFFQKNKDIATATTLFQKCIALQPHQSRFYNWYGKCLIEQNKYELASEAFFTALDLKYNNFETIRSILKINVKAPLLAHANLQKLLASLAKSPEKVAPNFFLPYVKKVSHSYHSDYLKWWSLAQKRKNNIAIFVYKLLSTDSAQVHNRAVEALLTFRHQPGIQEEIKRFLDKPLLKKEIRKRLQDTWQIIMEKKYRDQKYATYYRMAHFFLKNDKQMEKELKQHKNIVLQILKDPKEKNVHRFLAARTLILLLDFAPIQQMSQSPQITSAVIATAALCERGFPTSKSAFERFPKKSSNLFLKMLTVLYMTHQEKLWSRFSLDKNPMVRLCAASNIATSLNIPDKTLQQARHILTQNTKNASAKIRRAAHFYLWLSYTKRKPQRGIFRQKTFTADFPYKQVLLNGLNDKDLEVTKTVLLKAVYTDIPEYISTLEKIFQTSPSKQMRYHVLFPLWVSKPQHPIFQKLIYDHKYSYDVRIYAFFLHLLGFIPKDAKNAAFEMMRKYLALMQQIPKIAGDPDPYFRGIALVVLANFGDGIVKHIAREKNENVLSLLLMGMGIKPPLPILATISRRQKLKIARKYLTHSVTNVRKAAAVTLTKLSIANESLKMYKELKQLQDPAIHKGAALGFLQGFIKILDQQDLVPKTPEPKTKGHKQLLDIFFKKDSKTRRRCMLLLNLSLKLADIPQGYYMRALIYKQQGKIEKAVLDLNKAMEGHFFFHKSIVKLGEIYHQKKQKKLLLGLLEQVKFAKNQATQMEAIAQLALKANRGDIAATIYSQLCLLGPDGKYFLGLARALAMTEKEAPKILYCLKYARSYKKWKQKITRKNLAQYPELQTVMQKAWIQQLPE